MSKAFTSEETALDPPVVRARAPLPAGTPNYVTLRGLKMLQDEVAQLEREKAAAEGATDESERARAAALATRLTDLLGRLHSAMVVDPSVGPPDEVRFGATVTTRDGDGRERQFQIVGVDEANGREGRVAFTSPVARALLGRRPGDLTTVRSPRGEDELEVVAIRYAGPEH